MPKLTKKQEKEMTEILMQAGQVATEVSQNIALALGFDIMPDSTLVDQDTFQIVMFRKHVLRFNANLQHMGDVVFNPLANYKLAEYLFKIFIQKQTQDSDKYVSIYFPVQINDKIQLKIKYNTGEEEVTATHNKLESCFVEYIAKSVVNEEYLLILISTYENLMVQYENYTI